MDYCEMCLREFDQEELTMCGSLLLCEECEDEYEVEQEFEDGFHELDLKDEDF